MKRRTEQHILLLTATITPLNGINKLAYTDPAKRLRDYERALEHYLSLLRPNEQIVFCENSGSNLDSLRDIARRMNVLDRIEFVSFHGNDFPPHYGRGYGEFKMVEHVMNTSQVIREAHHDTVIWKITGRYIVENLHDVTDTKPRKSALYCNFRDYPKKGWMDLFLMAWTPASYRAYLAGAYPKLIEDRDGQFVSAELLMREHLAERRFAGPYRFKRTPRLVGVRGADGAQYNNNQGRRKYLVRHLMSIVAPWVWI
jgi:hypothetical protein